MNKLYFILSLVGFNLCYGQLFFTENFEYQNFQTFKTINENRERWTFFHSENQDFNNNRNIDEWEEIKSIDIIEREENNRIIRFELNRMRAEILKEDVMKKGEIDGEKVDYPSFFNHINRAEISTWDYPHTNYKPNKKYNFEFSIMIPEDFEFEKKNCNNPSESNYDLTGQWHFSNAIKEKTKPPLSLRIVCDTWYLSIIRESNPKEENFNFIPIGKVEKGKWVDWQFKFRLSHKNRGFIELYKDNELVYSEKKTKNIASKYSEDGKKFNYYFKIGVYKPHWWSRKSDVTKRVVYFDNLNISR